MGGSGNVFNLCGLLLTKGHLFFALFMPVLCIVFIAVGFVGHEIEDNVGNLWIPEKTDYAKAMKYALEVNPGDGVSSFYGISKPRQGGNMWKSSLLLELQELQNRSQRVTVDVDGVTFHHDDVCANFAQAYVFPCYRMTVLDCFYEGGYDFGATAAFVWRGMVTPIMTQMQTAANLDTYVAMYVPQYMEDGWKVTLGMLYDEMCKTVLTTPANPTCSTICNNTAGAPSTMIAASTGMPAGAWNSNAACLQCVDATLKTMKNATLMPTGPATLDAMYFGGAWPMVAAAMPGATPAGLKVTFNVSTNKELIDHFMRLNPDLQKMVKAEVTAGTIVEVKKQIAGMVSGAINGQNPYSFKTYGADAGYPRPMLKNPQTGVYMPEDEVLMHTSGNCWPWDGGDVMPANLNQILYGAPKPAVYNRSINLTAVVAHHAVYQFEIPKYVVTRMKNPMRPAAIGGPKNITEDTALKALEAWKQRFEEEWTKGWNGNTGGLQNTGFSDDTGSSGTFARTLSKLTTQSGPLIILYAFITVFFAGIILASINLVSSRAIIGFIGAIMAIMGFFGGLGLSVLMFNMKLHVVHFWILPFVLIGIGIDDMFMLALSDQAVEGSANEPGSAAAFAEAFGSVAVPVTMTSLVNGTMFLVLAVTSDIKAIYEAGYTGMVCTMTLYLTMLISFAPLAYLDGRRRINQRLDCLPGVKGSSSSGAGSGFSKALYDRLYRPMFTNIIARSILLLLSVVLLGVCASGLTKLTVGLDMQDFFPGTDPAGTFAKTRNMLFPVWPITVNWGPLAYEKPDIQLSMVKQWEDLGKTKRVEGQKLRSTLVWTASMANYFAKLEEGGNADAACKATWVANTKGLMLRPQGICRKKTGGGEECPVLDFTGDQTKLVACANKWMASAGGGYEYSLVSPGLKRDKSDPKKKIGGQLWPIAHPLVISRAAGNVLFAVDLGSTEDIVSMIEDSRKIVDDSSLCPKPEDCFMSDTPFDFWEQYLTILNVMVTVSGYAVLFSFFIAWLFLVIEFTMAGRGGILQRILASGIGAFLISLVSIASLVSVCGFCGLASIQISGFTAMSCVISTGLAVEYTVHVVHRFLEAPSSCKTGADRVHHAMEWLFKPTIMAFVTSALGVLMMAFSDFMFVRLYFFAPLASAVIVSYFYGIFCLPACLAFLGCLPVLEQK